ncbi:glycosyltransferase family 2 protein [Roseburia inulinivorans]|uniref:Glycosyltransferase family 2 protein n=1 Tax=Roseburia inulinivorans TaxID=360807 RepID=A0A396AEF9_9FIRM|nr:hypothetical protein [Roseburia inulinivorans]RHD04291.1 hypothetical protein DW813_06310 [Roseburia inulinivorans]
MSNPIVSLCMPTNGVIEWVFPVLDSIYEQGCENEDFEIVITDNGNNKEFKEKIKIYNQKHLNLYYFETNALPFINEIESYKRANGRLIKFVNHRTLFVEGALNQLIGLAKENSDAKPIMYFANGVLKKEKKVFEYATFDEFVNNLSYWSSWSTGMTIWKEDFDKLPEDVSDFNELFPHTNVLFNERNRNKYVIDNTVIFNEIPQGRKPKGDYDLFYAFGVEYPSIILNLYRENSITADTLRSVLKDNLRFVAYMYSLYFIKKEYCSYDLNGLKDMYNIFYTKNQLVSEVLSIFIGKVTKRLKK